MRLGVIDVGTNSVRVLVADHDEGALVTVDRDLVITRLGEGVDRDRRLGAEPLRRTVDAIASYVRRCHEAGVELLSVAATSAVRDASNREQFIDVVREATGLQPVVLTGEDEARYGFAGAAGDLSGDRTICVVDIGGGSTEFILGRGEAERWISIDIGSVRLTERHVRSDPPSEEDLDRIEKDAQAHLGDVESVVQPTDAEILVGLAGTITTAAAIALGLPRYDRDAIHHARLSRRRVAEIRTQLGAMTSEQRRKLPAMPRGREDVIVAGIVILECVMARFGFEECLVSEADILDGLALALATA
jgi:exopolyphosphatase/guanosine-5'-triphosphate,3'-diphosphate pyrophosphatase